MDLRRTRLETMLKVLDVDGAVKRVKGGWTATGQPWAYDAERYAWVARQRAAEQQAMRDYVSTTECRMEFLRRQLDDEGAAPCGRCDNCAGAWVDSSRLGGDADAGRRRSWTARGWRSSRAGCGRRACPRWASTSRGVSRPASSAPPGVPWGGSRTSAGATGCARCWPPNAPDGPVPDDVLRAAVAVLADWARSPGGWAPDVPDASARPVGVVAVPSLARPQLVGSLAEGIATIGRLPFLGTLTYTGPGGAHAARRSNSAQRLRALSGAFTVPEELAGALAGISRPRPARGRLHRLRLDPRSRRPPAPPGGQRAGAPAGPRSGKLE